MHICEGTVPHFMDLRSWYHGRARGPEVSLGCTWEGITFGHYFNIRGGDSGP